MKTPLRCPGRWLASFVLAALAAATPLACGADPGDSQQWLAVLKSDAPHAEKAMACKHLALVADADAADTLADLLSDPQLASWARIALEAMPHEAATDALLSAANDLEGERLIGAIRSLAARRDQKAVAFLVDKLHGGDSTIAEAAAIALGEIGSKGAFGELIKFIQANPDSVETAAEACLLSAEKRSAAGDFDSARRLYAAVLRSKASIPRHAEATRGAILANKTDNVGLLEKSLLSEERAVFRAAVSAARELESPAVVDAIVAALDDAPEPHRPPLIALLRDLALPKSLPTLRRLAGAENGPAVRAAALLAIGDLGGAEDVAQLLSGLQTEDAQVSESAAAALERLAGERVNAVLVAEIEPADGESRAAILDALGNRRAPVFAAYVGAMDDQSADVRSAAYSAFAMVASRDQVVRLVEGVKQSRAEDRAAAAKALASAVSRFADDDTLVDQLVVAFNAAPDPAKADLLAAIAAHGSSAALVAIQDNARGAGEPLQDAATRLLGQWFGVEAADPLEDFARNAVSERLRVRALRGYLRLARQFTKEDSERAAMCQTAALIASRDEERELAFQALEQRPSLAALNAAVALAGEPKLAERGIGSARMIAGKLGAESEAVAAALERLPQ